MQIVYILINNSIEYRHKVDIEIINYLVVRIIKEFSGLWKLIELILFKFSY